MAVISSPASKSLLRAYFSRSFAYYIPRGRPNLNIRSFFSTSHIPTFPAPLHAHIYASAFPSPASPLALTPNPWLQIIQSALVHPDDHLCKIQRALAHYRSLYGEIAPGEFKDTELEGSEFIDGTLFVRGGSGRLRWIGLGKRSNSSRFEGCCPGRGQIVPNNMVKRQTIVKGRAVWREDTTTRREYPFKCGLAS
ncbi:hypothetical protein B0H19DRAFT_936933 [Mycena capillaripes]|nr:hypothetical protein B0H19DRAFT_936933 [Mycena capillaripes]